MKRPKIIYKILIFFIFLTVGLLVLNSKFDKIVLAFFLATFLFALNEKKKSRLFFSSSGILIILSTILYILNDPSQSLTYYLDKLAIWSFYFFVAGVFGFAFFQEEKND